MPQRQMPACVVSFFATFFIITTFLGNFRRIFTKKQLYLHAVLEKRNNIIPYDYIFNYILLWQKVLFYKISRPLQ